MKKIVLFIIALMPFMVSCEKDKENEEDNIKINLDVTNLTDDGYFDGLLYYKVTSNSPSEVCINKADKSAVNVEIPSYIKISGTTYKCTSIAEKAFYQHENLTSIIIPKEVKKIGSSAFFYCGDLVSLTISEGLENIGDFAFSGCSCLSSLTIPSSLKYLGMQSFSGCYVLSDLKVLSGVTSIGQGSFLDCIRLTSVILPESVTRIGVVAFKGCTKLTSVIIPNSVTKIESGAFMGCSSLTTITIPENVSTIGSNAFLYSNKLASIYCKAITPPSYPDNEEEGIWFDGNVYDNATLYVPKGCSDKYQNAVDWKYFKNIVEE